MIDLLDKVLTEKLAKLYGFTDEQILFLRDRNLLDIDIALAVHRLDVMDNDYMMCDPLLDMIRLCEADGVESYCNYHGKIDTVFLRNGIVYRFIYKPTGVLEAIIDTGTTTREYGENAIIIMLQFIPINPILVLTTGNALVMGMYTTPAGEIKPYEYTFTDTGKHNGTFPSEKKPFHKKYLKEFLVDANNPPDYSEDDLANMNVTSDMMRLFGPHEALASVMDERGYDNILLSDLKEDENVVPYPISIYGLVRSILFTMVEHWVYIAMDEDYDQVQFVVARSSDDKAEVRANKLYDDKGRLLEVRLDDDTEMLLVSFEYITDDTNLLKCERIFNVDGSVSGETRLSYTSGKLTKLSFRDFNSYSDFEYVDSPDLPDLT